jgi:hypothetical protein
MRLLRIRSNGGITLEEFHGDRIPHYAILSHTWGEEEVTFQEFSLPAARQKQGWKKIEYCCAQAAKDGLEYAWVDTCCIDKSSSAELSEAINSMYSWYQKSAICYAYLSDVSRDELLKEGVIMDNLCGYTSDEDTDVMRIVDHEYLVRAFTDARWFSRGWTLQELIAPRVLTFFSSEWLEIGSRHKFESLLSQIAGIPISVLAGTSDPSDASIANRMSWASRRTTTRVEDIAYCLLGIFNVNIPLLYGEGLKAFQRLQEEIMRISDDQSLFAWEDRRGLTSGLLAESPAEFADAGDIVGRSSPFDLEPYAMTNKGLRIQLPMKQENETFYFAALNCTRQGRIYGLIVILLRCIQNNEFSRAARALTEVTDMQQIREWDLRTIFVKRGYHLLRQMDASNLTIRLFHTPRGEETDVYDTLKGFRLAAIYPSISWSGNTGVLAVTKSQSPNGIALLYERYKDNFVVWIKPRGSGMAWRGEKREYGPLWDAIITQRIGDESLEDVIRVSG